MEEEKGAYKVNGFEFDVAKAPSEKKGSPSDKKSSLFLHNQSPQSNDQPFIFSKEKGQGNFLSTYRDNSKESTFGSEEGQMHQGDSSHTKCFLSSNHSAGDYPAPKRIYLILEANALKKNVKNQNHLDKARINSAEINSYRLHVDKLNRNAEKILREIKPFEETNLKRESEEINRKLLKECSFGTDPRLANFFENSINQTSIPTAHSVAHQESETSIMLQKLVSGRETGISIPETEKAAAFIQSERTAKKLGETGEGSLKMKSMREIENLEKLILNECNDIRRLRGNSNPAKSCREAQKSSTKYPCEQPLNNNLRNLEEDFKDITSIMKKAVNLKQKSENSGDTEILSKNSNFSLLESFSRGTTRLQDTKENILGKLLSPASYPKKKSDSASCFKFIKNFETPEGKRDYTWIKKNVIERNQEWLLAKQKNEREKREASALKEVSQCTFRPSTSKGIDVSLSGRKNTSNCFTPQRNYNPRDPQLSLKPQTSKKDFFHFDCKSSDLISGGSLSVVQQKYEKDRTFREYYGKLENSGSYKKKYQLRKIIETCPVAKDFNLFIRSEMR